MGLLNNMRFAGFEFPYNPATLDVKYSKRFSENEYPDVNGAELEFMGLGPRIISGSGAFFGIEAYRNYEALSREYLRDTAESLIIPIHGSIRCQFTDLTISHEPTANYVEYTFEFKESHDINVITRIPPPPQPPAPPEVRPLGVVQTTANLWLHSAPDISVGSRIRILPKGTKWKHYGITNNMYGLGSGQWAHKDYLRVIETYAVGNPIQHQATSYKMHVVQKGENLSSISKKYYNNPASWRKIADANKDIVRNPNTITPGMKLNIP